jgi:hypothetical protein
MNMSGVRTLLGLALALMLAGCASQDISWTPVAGVGPYLYEGVGARVFRRCERRLMDGAAQCEIAFEDANGQKLEVFKTLIPQLDAYLQDLAEYKTWPRTNGIPVQTKIPFKLYLLTISPAIVVLVPDPPDRRETCWRDAPAGNCLRSYVAFGNGYDLSSKFPIVAGSYWYAPGRTKGLQALPVEGSVYALPLENVNAKVVRVESSWEFRRAR